MKPFILLSLCLLSIAQAQPFSTQSAFSGKDTLTATDGTINFTQVNPRKWNVSATSFWQAGTGNSLSNTNTGAVGIGTTNPAGKLHVVRTETSISPVAQFTGNPGFNNTTNSCSILLENTNSQNYNGELIFKAAGTIQFSVGSGIYKNTERNFYIYDYVNATTRLLIDSTGKIGIGTATPLAPLHVQSITRGVLFPRMTGQQAEAMIAAETLQEGEWFYDLTAHAYKYWNGSLFKEVATQ